jgi:predicted HicB family RNase H-like nuclease
MAKPKASFKLIRVTELTHTRLKIKAARAGKKLYQFVEQLSLA